MKILIVATMTNNFGKRGSYNSQEIGLARGLSNLGHEVIVYKTVVDPQDVGVVKLSDKAVIKYIECKIYFGSNGYLPLKYLDSSAQILIQFADLQLSVPMVYKWCKNNNIEYFPYIGVTWTQTKHKFLKKTIKLLSLRNFSIYRKSKCFAKTNKAKNELEKIGVNNVKIAPVCLDFEQLNKSYLNCNLSQLRYKWGIPNGKTLLFIGRLEEDKHPLDVIDIFKKLENSYSNLIIVGKGSLREELVKKIKDNGLERKVFIVDSVPNKDIWEIYRISDWFVNLNPNEIWGMALLEAMYYRLPIIAIDAPGPKAMILDGKTGFLANNHDEICKKLSSLDDYDEMAENAFNRVINIYNWVNTAKVFVE